MTTHINTNNIHHEALSKLLNEVANKGHNPANVTTITLTKRFNPQTGNHVHASCKVTLRFDTMATEHEVNPKAYDAKF